MEYITFVRFLFDRPDSEWYLDSEFTAPELMIDEAVHFTTQVFERSEAYADRYSEVQLCLGLNYLINPTSSDHCYLLLDNSVSDVNRICALRAMHVVFDKVFKNRCTDATARGSNATLRSYRGLCYLWWDIFPRHGTPFQDGLKAIDQTILETLEKVLLLDSSACKESAIHGLGHWQSAYPELVERILDENSSKIPVSLAAFARQARMGKVQ